MKTIFCINLAILLNVLPAIAQDNPRNLSVNELSNAVVMLYQKKNGTVDIRGTATIVNYNSKYLLITARHIAEVMKSTTKVVFSGPENSGVEEDLIFLTSSIDGIPWIHHPKADVSILEIVPVNDFHKARFQNFSIKLDWLDNQSINFPIGTVALFFGFSGIYAKALFFSCCIDK